MKTPEFFCTGLAGIAADGPNVQLSFASFTPNLANNDRTYEVNVRIVMSSDSLTQMVEFLQRSKAGQLPDAAPPN
jgi:hypothetical protein